MTSERSHRVSTSCDNYRISESTQHRFQSVIQRTATLRAWKALNTGVNCACNCVTRGSKFSFPRIIWNNNICTMYCVLSKNNSRCCCKETPSTAGWNLHNFYPHYTEISKAVSLSEMCAFITNVCCVKRAYLSQARKRVLCKLDCIMCLGRTYCMTFFFFQNDFWMKCR